MALFKFTKAILNGDPIDVYNHGEMSRDFTYIDDLVNAMMLLIGSIQDLILPNPMNTEIGNQTLPHLEL